MEKVYVNQDDFLDDAADEGVHGSATEYTLFTKSALDETVYQAG